MTTKKVALRVSLEIDVNEWADEYGCEPREVPDNVRNYVRAGIYAALQSMPVEPKSMEVR